MPGQFSPTPNPTPSPMANIPHPTRIAITIGLVADPLDTVSVAYWLWVMLELLLSFIIPLFINQPNNSPERYPGILHTICISELTYVYIDIVPHQWGLWSVHILTYMVVDKSSALMPKDKPAKVVMRGLIKSNTLTSKN